MKINIKGNVKLSSNKSVTITAADEITLKTADSSLWLPNTMAICPYTSLPHGGPGAGITKLNGGA